MDIMGVLLAKEWLQLSRHYSCNAVCHAGRARAPDYLIAPAKLEAEFRHDTYSFFQESVKHHELHRLETLFIFLLSSRVNDYVWAVSGFGVFTHNQTICVKLAAQPRRSRVSTGATVNVVKLFNQFLKTIRRRSGVSTRGK